MSDDIKTSVRNDPRALRKARLREGTDWRWADLADVGHLMVLMDTGPAYEIRDPLRTMTAVTPTHLGGSRVLVITAYAVARLGARGTARWLRDHAMAEVVFMTQVETPSQN
jgi:hypothetical protein